MLPSDWFDCLYEEYQWLRDYQEDPDLLIVVNRILEQEDFYDITDVYQSSIWAVCHAYIDYCINTSFLTEEELEYTRGRGGVIGSGTVNGHFAVASIREFLEEYDRGFERFMGGDGVPGA